MASCLVGSHACGDSMRCLYAGIYMAVSHALVDILDSLLRGRILCGTSQVRADVQGVMGKGFAFIARQSDICAPVVVPKSVF